MILNKIRSIIIDDEENNITNLKILLKEYCPKVKVIGEASNVDDAIELINKQNPDLLFLDVEIKNSTGFDILEGLSNRNFNVIFVTAFDQYAIKALRFSAVDYLLKPISIEELEEAVEKVYERMLDPTSFEGLDNLLNNMRTSVKNHRIGLPLSGSIEFVNISDIIRCKGEGAYTTFYLINSQKIVVSKTLKEFQELLDDYSFLRVHKSHLINLNFVKTFVKSSDAHVVMDDGSTVTVSSSKKQELLKNIKSFLA